MDTPPPEVAAVAAALRTASTWMTADQDRRLLLEAADNAEWYWDRGTCPVCEEPSVCDQGCPFREARARRDQDNG